MREISIFVSLPSLEKYEEFYYTAVKPISRGNISTVSMYDRQASHYAFETDIHRLIAYCNLIIVILSKEKLSNVMYEFGLAIAHGKPFLILAESIDFIPAMVMHRHTIIFDKNRDSWKSLEYKILEKCKEILLSGISNKRLVSHSLGLALQTGDDSTKSPDDYLGFESNFEKGHYAYEAGDYKNAIEFLSKVFDTNEDVNEEVYFYLSDSHFLYAESISNVEKKNIHYTKQLKIAKKGTELYPHRQDIKKNYGLANLKLKRLSEAEKVFFELLQDDSEYHVARYDLACVYSMQDKLFKCISELSTLFNKSDRARQWRGLARLDPDFDNMWMHPLYQTVIYPSIPIH